MNVKHFMDFFYQLWILNSILNMHLIFMSDNIKQASPKFIYPWSLTNRERERERERHFKEVTLFRRLKQLQKVKEKVKTTSYSWSFLTFFYLTTIYWCLEKSQQGSFTVCFRHCSEIESTILAPSVDICHTIFEEEN